MESSSKVTVDIKVKRLIEITNEEGHRSFFVIYGEEVQKKVMYIHHLISKQKKERPSILWCHNKDSTTPGVLHKLAKKFEKSMKRNKCEMSEENSFDAFLLSTKIKFCSFDNTTSIMGATYGMCVIQDYSSLTPNILCQITETVAGGGALILLLPGICTIRKLFGLKMDVHKKLQTDCHKEINPLYNRRFVQSFIWCKSCIILDESLAISTELPLRIVQNVNQNNLAKIQENADELSKLLESLSDAEKPLPQLVGACKTNDQAKVLLKLLEVLTEKNGKATVSITSGRGRGKSSVLGLGVAGAINLGLSNIFIVSPTPDNLGSFFECLFKGFDALDYKESEDYTIYQSTNHEFKGSVIKVLVYGKHRQVIQYVSPNDYRQINQAELVVIDEAAAIPLPYIKPMIGSHNVLMASTVNGYEGTGRSLSMKLLEEIRRQSVIKGATKTNTEESMAFNCRPLYELNMEQSIRYFPNDPVEAWLHQLLCLDATENCPTLDTCPPPVSCQLYNVNRSVLFSGHHTTEPFLSNIISLLVASHYKNCPDDLQLLSDAPSHELFVLIPPKPSGAYSKLPSILCVIQVCLEGNIPEHTSINSIKRGEKPSGHLIPWLIASKFFDPKLTELTGVRIVRIACHPSFQSMGYGSRAMKLLMDFYSRRFIDIENAPKQTNIEESHEEKSGIITLKLPSYPLLNKLDEISPPRYVDYVGVSFGLTEPLYRFWKRLNFKPLHISQVGNNITGEHNCVVVRSTEDLSPDWLKANVSEFCVRFNSLLGGQFKQMHPRLAFNIIQSSMDILAGQIMGWSDISNLITSYDIKRLESFCRTMSDRYLITDLFPSLALLYFQKHLKDFSLSNTQAEILVGLGFQCITIEEIAKFLSLPIESCLGQFKRMVKRILTSLVSVQEKEVSQHLPTSITDISKFTPVEMSLDADLEHAAQEFTQQQRKNIHSTVLGDVSKYTIKGDTKEWDDAADIKKDIVSIKSVKQPRRMTEEQLEQELRDPTKKTKSKKKRRK